MKNILSSLVILVSIFAFANDALSPLEKQLASRMRSYGGDIIDRRNSKGKLIVVNGQKAASDSLINSAIASATAGDIKVDYEISVGTFEMKNTGNNHEALLFIVDDNKFPMSLIAPEAKWALVNIAELKTDKEAFFEARVKKQIARAIGQLFGAASNQYDTNLFSGVFCAKDLDYIPTTSMPRDYRLRFSSYIPSMGIIPYKVVHYKKAVQEGWAPAPTNEFQKAIWDKVHEIPAEPIKIKRNK